VIFLWPMVVALSGSSSEAAKLNQAGKGVLIEALRDMDIEALFAVAKGAASLPANEILAGVIETTEEVQTVLHCLSRLPRIIHVTDGLQKKNILGPGTYALNLDTTDPEEQASNQQSASFYATFTSFQPLTMCTIKAVNFLLILVGLGLVGTWFFNQMWMDRIYVKLKVHRDFFGSKMDEIEQQRPASDKQNHKVEQFLGFYLPPSKDHPHRLREMATALLVPPEKPCPQPFVRSVQFAPDVGKKPEDDSDSEHI